ncbi:MAG: hypothetical protein KBE91_12445 [Bacteroidia bacterium]|nr:hypothetical protein [Bacteroidia bacterium]
MKKLTINIFLIIGLFATLSCSKEEDNATPNSSATDLTGCKVISMTNENYKIVYAYNTNGTIKTVTEYYASDTTTPVEVYTYTHTNGSVTYVNKSMRERGYYTINAAGRVTTSDIIYYDGPDSSTATSGKMTGYEYNTDGYLNKKTVTFSSAAGASTTIYSYIWMNGNITNEITVSQSGSTSNTAYTYYTDKSNAFSSLTSLTEFIGPDSKNLVKAITNATTGSLNESYSYEFDASGKPIKTTVTDNSNTYTFTSTFMCP